MAWAYEEAMNLSDRPEILKATGISRTDVFFDEKFIANAFEKSAQTDATESGKER